MQKRMIWLCYAIAFLQGLLFYAPISTLYRQTNGISIFEITLIESISLAVSLAMELPWGWIADRIGYRNTLVICHFLFFLSKVFFWRADGFAWFLAERLLLSVVLSGLSGCDTAYLFLAMGGKNCPERESRRIFGCWEAMNTAGLVLACVLFSWFIRENYRLSALLTVYSYGAAWLLSVFLPSVPAEITAPRPHLRALCKLLMCDRRFFLFLLGCALLEESKQTITVFLNQLQYLRSGIPPATMGICTILVTFSGLSSMQSHRLSTRLGERRTVILIFGAGGLACILMAICAHPLLSVVGMMLLCAANSAFVPLRVDLQNRHISVSSRATMLSIHSLAMNMTAVGTNLAFGALAERSVVYALLLGVGFCFSGLFMCFQGNVLAKKR